MKFSIYKELILSKSNGQNIHNIKAALAFIHENGKHLKNNTFDNPEYKEIFEEAIKDYLLDLGKKTGVKYSLDELEF